VPVRPTVKRKGRDHGTDIERTINVREGAVPAGDALVANFRMQAIYVYHQDNQSVI